MSGYTGTVGRTVLELALCYMAIEDIVAAEKALVEYSSYCDPDDLKLFSDIVEAFNRLDRKAVLQLLTHPFIQNLDPEYVRLAKLIPLPPNPPVFFMFFYSSLKRPLLRKTAPIWGLFFV